MGETPPPVSLALLLFLVLNHVAMLFVCAFPDWKHSSWQISQGLIGRVATFQGAWWQCFSPKWGLFVCDNYGKVAVYSAADIQAARALMIIATIFSFIGVLIALLSLDCTTIVEPDTKAKKNTALFAGICYIITAHLQAQRALMVIAVVLSFIGIVIGMISLRCTTMIDNQSRRKSGVGIAAGVCIFLSALSCGVAVSWYAVKVSYEYFNYLYQEREFKYEFGACLYLGWVATLLGTCTLITTIWFGVNVQQQYYDPLHKNDAFKYEYGACLYVGWVAGALTLIAGLILIIGSCRTLTNDDNDTYTPSKAYVYKPQTNTLKSNGKAEYV